MKLTFAGFVWQDGSSVLLFKIFCVTVIEKFKDKRVFQELNYILGIPYRQIRSGSFSSFDFLPSSSLCFAVDLAPSKVLFSCAGLRGCEENPWHSEQK